MTSKQHPALNTKQWLILLIYPLVPLTLAVATTVIFGIGPLNSKLPSPALLSFAAICGFLLIVNHSWLMTHTEVTRSRYGLFATPEEAAQGGQNAPGDQTELTRSHAAHRNLTENTTLFAILMPIYLLLSPPETLAAIWLLGYGFSRLGHTYFFLSGNANWRGVFMTTSLVALYGLAFYPVLVLI